MFFGFKQRRPYAAVLITLIFGPAVGMAYLNRGRLALGYIVISLIVAMGAMMLWQRNSALSLMWDDAVSGALFLLNVIASSHVYCVAQRRMADEVMCWYSRWYWMLLLAALFELAAFAFRHYAYEPFHLPSDSMSPTLQADDYFFAEKFAYRTRLPERGDVVVFRKDGISYVKRIIGLPGDTVQLTNGIIYLNGSPVMRRRLADFDLHGDKVPQFVETLPNGPSYMVLDLPTHSRLDDMALNPVRPHHYFVLSDNRDQTAYKWVNAVGMIEESAIIGKAGHAVLSREKL